MKRKILYWICLIIAVLSVSFLVSWFYLKSTQEEVYEEMQGQNQDLATEAASTEEEKIVIPIDFASFQKENEDIYAWIRLPDTKVDYPILQHPEDDFYYLDHTVDKKKGLPGSIYTESVNAKDFTDPVTLIYGHNMRNGSMFGDLSLYVDETYMDEHRQILIYTPEHIYTYEVFGAVTYDNRHIMHSFDFSAGVQDFIDSMYSVRNMNSFIDKDIVVEPDDKVIVLSTCNGNDSQRFIVGAVLVDEQ